MDQGIERYWLDVRSDAVKKFAQEQENIKNLNLDLLKSIITIQATILGISIALMGYVKASPNFFLISTWVIEIISIALGFLLFKIHIDKESKTSFQNLRLYMDITEVNLLEVRGEFIGNKEKKEGMLIAALTDGDPRGDRWTDYAKKVAEKYRSELPSTKLFKEIKKTKASKLKEILLKYQMKFIIIFYCLVAISFSTLLLSILIK